MPDEIQIHSVTLPVNIQTATTHRDFLEDNGLVHVAARMLASPEVHVPVETNYYRTRPGVFAAVLRYWVSPALWALPGSGTLLTRLRRAVDRRSIESETVIAQARVSQRVCPHVPIPDQSYRANYQREHVRWLLGEE